MVNENIMPFLYKPGEVTDVCLHGGVPETVPCGFAGTTAPWNFSILSTFYILRHFEEQLSFAFTLFLVFVMFASF